MGDYAPRDEPYAFQIPAGDIPNGYGSAFATGRYKSFIRYTAANFGQPLLEREGFFEIA